MGTWRPIFGWPLALDAIGSVSWNDSKTNRDPGKREVHRASPKALVGTLVGECLGSCPLQRALALLDDLGPRSKVFATSDCSSFRETSGSIDDHCGWVQYRPCISTTSGQLVIRPLGVFGASLDPHKPGKVLYPMPGVEFVCACGQEFALDSVRIQPSKAQLFGHHEKNACFSALVFNASPKPVPCQAQGWCIARQSQEKAQCFGRPRTTGPRFPDQVTSANGCVHRSELQHPVRLG